MSDVPQGPGWWQASDGRWYPPEQFPSPRYPTQPYPPQPYPTEPPPGAGWGAAPQPGAGAGYGTGPSYGAGTILAPPPAQSSTKATTALVLAIVSFFVCPAVLAIVALVVAGSAAREIRESPYPLGGEGTVKAARIVAIANIVVSVLAVIAVAAIAVPVFHAARDSVWDRETQNDVRLGYQAARTLYTRTNQWPNDPAALHEVAPTLSFSLGEAPTTEGVVYTLANGTTVYVSQKSRSGTCWYLESTVGLGVRYAKDKACGTVDAQSYSTTPWRTTTTTP